MSEVWGCGLEELPQAPKPEASGGGWEEQSTPEARGGGQEDQPHVHRALAARAQDQGIFLTQASNARLLHWQVDSLLLRHLGSPGSKDARC